MSSPEDRLIERVEGAPAYVTADEARVLLTIIRGLRKELVKIKQILKEAPREDDTERRDP